MRGSRGRGKVDRVLGGGFVLGLYLGSCLGFFRLAVFGFRFWSIIEDNVRRVCLVMCFLLVLFVCFLCGFFVLGSG